MDGVCGGSSFLSSCIFLSFFLRGVVVAFWFTEYISGFTIISLFCSSSFFLMNILVFITDQKVERKKKKKNREREREECFKSVQNNAFGIFPKQPFV